MPESKNRFYVSPFQGDAQLSVRTCIFVKNANMKFSHFSCIFVKNANIKFSHFFGIIAWSAFFVELNFVFVRTKSVNFQPCDFVNQKMFVNFRKILVNLY